MNGHVRKRGKLWEVVLELGDQAAQRCAACVTVDKRGRERGKVYWADDGRLDACPTCEGVLDDVTARRQIVLPERFRTKKEAGEALTRELNADLNGVFVEPDKITLGEYLTEHWLPNMAESVRATTLLSYRGHVVAYLVPMLGDVPLRKLSPTAINAFHATLRTQPRRARSKPKEPKPVDTAANPADAANGQQEAAETVTPEPLAPLSERTRLHIHITLNAALNAAVDEGLIAVNPARRAKAPRPGRRNVAELHTWTDAELRTFLESAAGDRLASLWRLLAATGMRRGEALGLKWSDVDLAGGRVSIQRARVTVGYEVCEAPPKTEQSRRVVTMDAGTVATLKAWKAQQAAERLKWGAAWQGGAWLFTREDGEPMHPDRVTKLFGDAVAGVDVPRIRLHDLRHTSATLALAAGLHPKVVQERLGHATISQTMDTYSHTTQPMHDDAAAKLGAIIDGAS